MTILKADKIVSADIVHTDSGLLGGKPPEYYAKSDQSILPWQSGRVYACNELCYKDGDIYKSKVDNNSAFVTDMSMWKICVGEIAISRLETCLVADGWIQDENSFPYPIFTQVLEISEITENTIGQISVSDLATDEQYAAAKEADLRKTSQATGSIMVKAYGEQPNLDIPITIIFYK